jgi:hypothetical protein
MLPLKRLLGKLNNNNNNKNASFEAAGGAHIHTQKEVRMSPLPQVDAAYKRAEKKKKHPPHQRLHAVYVFIT